MTSDSLDRQQIVENNAFYSSICSRYLVTKLLILSHRIFAGFEAESQRGFKIQRSRSATVECISTVVTVRDLGVVLDSQQVVWPRTGAADTVFLRPRARTELHRPRAVAVDSACSVGVPALKPSCSVNIIHI